MTGGRGLDAERWGCHLGALEVEASAWSARRRPSLATVGAGGRLRKHGAADLPAAPIRPGSGGAPLSARGDGRGAAAVPRRLRQAGLHSLQASSGRCWADAGSPHDTGTPRYHALAAEKPQSARRSTEAAAAAIGAPHCLAAAPEQPQLSARRSIGGHVSTRSGTVRAASPVIGISGEFSRNGGHASCRDCAQADLGGGHTLG